MLDIDVDPLASGHRQRIPDRNEHEFPGVIDVVDHLTNDHDQGAVVMG